MKKTKQPLPGILEQYTPEEVDEALRNYYAMPRESPVQRIWIDALNRHVPDFTGASGRKYYIYTPEMGLPAGRAHGLRMAMDAFISNANLQTNVDGLVAIKNAYNQMLKDKDAAFLGYTIQAAINGVTTAYTAKNHRCLTACTFFIVSKEEDLSTWDEREAQEKVEDWKNINEMDFFFLALLYRGAWSGILTDFLAKSPKM